MIRGFGSPACTYDTPVDRSAQDVAGEHSAGDDEVAAERGGGEHQSRLGVDETVVVQTHAHRGQDLHKTAELVKSHTACVNSE